MHQPRTPRPGPPDDARDQRGDDTPSADTALPDGTAPPDATAPPPSPGGGDADDSAGHGDADADDGGYLVTAPRPGTVDGPLVELRPTRRARAASGKRMLSEATDHRGRYVGSPAPDPATDVAL